MIKNLSEIQENILSRYERNARDLPWRKTEDPYAIHVSEVMLQQTQVDRVIPYFYKRLKKRPDYSALAQADTTELLSCWSGLGFNSRALRLRECSSVIAALRPQGQTFWREELMKLPGIGPYTSAAILAFAHNIEVPVVDTNIRRVLIFLFKLDENIGDKALESFAEKIIPVGRSRDRHNALMDYGAMELTVRKTKISSKSKQSKFKGSDREVRGWILKKLVQRAESKVQNLLSIEEVEPEFPEKDVEKIVKGMVKDGLLSVDNGKVKIQN